jgi:hypothetical protein
VPVFARHARFRQAVSRLLPLDGKNRLTEFINAKFAMKLEKRILFALVPTAVIGGLLALGGVCGYALATRQMRSEFDKVIHNQTLGHRLLHTADRGQLAEAYDDPKSAAEAMDDFCYSVPTVVSPFVGYAPEPGQHHNAFSNSMQFRADKEVAMPKPPETFRIFLTGGSTAFGSGAPSQDRTIGAYLNAMLDKELTPVTRHRYEVFAMANPSWASTHERIIIENRLLDLQPDLVISFSGNNDVFWGMNGRNVMWFRTQQEEFNWRVLDWAYGVLRFKPMKDVVALDARPVAPTLVADRLVQNVQLSAFALGLKKTRYVFCLQPTLAVTRKPLDDAERNILLGLKTIDDSVTGSNYFAQCYADIDSRLAGLSMGNFTYVNLTDVFDTQPGSDRVFLDAYHFGDKGNALIARKLFDRLRDLLASPQP